MRCAIAPAHQRAPEQSLRRAKDCAPQENMTQNHIFMPLSYMFSNGKILGLFNNDCSKSQSLFLRVGFP